MRIKRYFGFSLILFIMIFSISFASADEISDIDSNDLSLSVSADVDINENLNDESLNSVDDTVSDEINSNSKEGSSTSDVDLKDDISDSDEIESDEGLTNNGKVPTLRASSDEEILGADHDLYGGSAQQVMNMIQQISGEGGGTLYLHGGTYTGTGTLGDNLAQNQMLNIANVRVVGGSPDNPNQMARFQPERTDSTSLIFRGFRTSADGAERSWSTSGVNLLNVTFENLNCTGRFFSFNSGSLTDCVFNNLESYQHLFFVIGSYMDSVPLRLTNVNFTNSKQTYVGDLPAGGTDGTGQFGVVFGAEMYGCNFINTSSATHGGAFCLSDEWVTSACVASKLVNCNFINITSRWFAVYIHGNYTDTPRFITEPQVLDNCKFINCTGEGEYGGALGISHNNVIINNSEFSHNTGGEGSAIMVGGIRNTHDGFLGVNTQGNNITIINCTFNDNVAKTEGQTSSHSTDPVFDTRPTGNAGAVYVYGNHTNIINSTFNNNTAVDACGAAIYIEGQNTTVVGSEFYDHNSQNGTIYLVGNDCEISDSYFHNNNATSTGACIYIEGNNAGISNTTFANNTAHDGGSIFIVGDHTVIENDTKFIDNNATNGAGVYVNGSNTEIVNSSFINNIAVNGAGALVNGHDTDVNGSYFEGNNATNGGGVYIEGDINVLTDNIFFKNNVTNQGGAVYINGHTSNITNNNFTQNEAVPASEDEETGLGGAIFVHGDDTSSLNNSFYHNKARNGSAIYTDGLNFKLENDVFFENQAWSYLLVVTAVPPVSLYNSQDVNITVVHRAGDNIINAIHNTASPDEVHFKNVTYIRSSGQQITTDPNNYVEPVDGVERSQGGTLLYQDDREDLQLIQVKVTHEDGEVFYHNTTLLTNIYGNVNFTLPRSSLRKGLYIVDAEHIEDWNYKFIVNATTFRILDSMDVSVNKTSDEDEYFQGEIADWEIVVHNVANGTDAEDVTITDFLPDVFNLTSLNYTFYDPAIGAFTNGTLYLNNNTLSYGVYNVSGGNWIYGNANYNSSSNTWTYYFLELDDDTIVYTVFDEDEFRNRFGNVVMENSTDVCYANVSYNIPSETWYYETITVDGQEIKYGVFNETFFTKYFGEDYYFDDENNTWVYTRPGIDPETGEPTTLYTWYYLDTGYWVIDYEVFSPERKTLTQKVSLSINPDSATNRTNIALFIKDFDKNDTGIIDFQTNCTKAGTYNNIVNVTTPDFDWDLSNNEANKTVLVDPLPNKTVSNSTPYYHEYVDYNLTIMNTGNQTYTHNIIVIDSLPEGLEYNETVAIIGATQVGETIVNGQTITWTVTNIPALTNATIIVKVRVNALGNLTNNMTLIAPSGSNRTVNTTITPVPYTDISVEKSVDDDEVFVGDIVVWTITVSVANNGSNATNVTLKDILPSEVEFIRSSLGDYDNNTGILYIGFMENGTSVTFTITSRARVVANDVTNNVTVNCTEDEWDYTNNFDNATIDILPINNKTANNTTPDIHEYVDYNLTIINEGNNVYTDVLTVIDSLPDGLVYNNTVGIYGADQVGETIVNGQTITWKVTNIRANTNATIIVRVRADAFAVLTNNYTIVGPKGSNRTVNETIVVQPKVDISVEKTADNETYHIGDNVIWTITVTNANNGTTANNVTLSDILPSQVEYVSSIASIGTYDNETGVWYIGTMQNGTSQTLIITTIARVNETNITNIANVSCNESEWDYENNIDNATINIVDTPINKTVSNPTPDYYEIVEYNLTVTNIANETYPQVVTLIDRLPEGVTYVETVSTTGLRVISFENSNNKTLTWTVTDIQANTEAIITIRANCTAIGTQMNTWEINGPNGFNKTVNVTINVNPKVDISVEKNADNETYHIGDNVIWTITVTNANNGTTANNVTLSDILPSQVEYVSSIASIGTYDNETGVWYIGTMQNGTSQTLIITTIARVNETNITNIANVSCNESEWDYENNIDNATINIVDTPINKTVSNPTPDYYEIVEYNLTVTNIANETYPQVVTLIDRLPEGVTYVETVSTTGLRVISFENSNNKTLTWTVTDIQANTEAIITIRANCTAIGTQMNTWEINGPNGFNKTVNVTINVNPKVDISVEKNADKEEYKVNETVTWTITVSNAANGTNATNVLLKDILPKEVEFVSYTATKGTYDNETGIWTIGNMANGTSETLIIISTAITPKYNVVNNATVNCTEDEWDYDNNFDNATISIIPTLEKTVNETNPYYHEIVEYNLTVINYGDETYTDNITVIDTLEDGLEFIETVNITGADIVIGETKNGQTITWVITNISTTNAVITVRVKANAIGDLENNLTIKTPKGTNMTVNRTITVEPIVDVSVEKTVDKEEYKVNETVTWNITVSNAGNGTNATNVLLKDILPKEVEYVSYTATKGTYDNETGIWTIGNMANGTSETLIIISTAITPKYNVVNNATVNCTEDEWDYDNNFDNATISIIPTLEKTVNETNPYYHEIVEYNLTVINYGDETYTDNITVIDTLEDGLEFIETVNITGADIVIGETKNGQTITWVITNISTTNAVITVRVKANAIGDLENNLTIKTPKGTNMTVNRTITVEPIVDVATNKTSDREEYFVDDIAIWTINVSNAANGTNATNVVLKDVFPSEFVFIDYTATKGTYDSKTGEWNIGFMENGTSVTLVIRSYAKIVTNLTTNYVNVTCNEDDWNLSNNVANKSVKVIDIPDVNKTVNDTTPFYNETVVYNLTIINTGDINYTNNISVIDSLPNGLEFIETVSITGAKLIKEVINGQKITWTITDIAAFSSAVIKVKVRALAIGELTNNLTIVAPNGTNKTVNCTIDPIPLADLAVTKTNDHYRIDCLNSTTVIWTIKVVNNGPNDAINAIAKDILPKGIIYISDDSNGKYNPKTGVWKLGDLANGSSRTINIKTKVNATNVIIDNEVVVSSETYDPNESNNYDNSSIKVIAIADLMLIKDANVTKVHVGDKFSYIITVINNGPDTAVNARVYDLLPKGLELLGFEASKGDFDPAAGIWRIGDMENGEVVTLIINVKALVTGKIINEAYVESDTFDNDTSNNKDSATVIVIKEHNPPYIIPTGNPLLIALLSLIAIVGVTLRRKV